MIPAADLTIVLQGPAPVDTTGWQALADRVRRLRAALPGAPVLWSTWAGSAVPPSIGLDRVLFSADPGPLPSFKVGACKPNNVNRQIVGSAAGLAAVATPYAMKLRVDAELVHAGLLPLLARLHALDARLAQRVVTVGRFSIDPGMFEQMPMHLSDWFQFGPTERLRALWSCPPMDAADATHYRRHPHAAHSTLFDRRFLARWPAEQHVWRAWAARLGYAVPDFHNDTAPAVLAAHEAFLAREVLLLDLPQAGVRLPALGWAERSGMQAFNCLSFLDWLWLADRAQPWPLPPALRRAMQRRRRAKQAVARAFRAASPLLPLLVRPPLKPAVGWLLRRLHRPPPSLTLLP